MPLDFTTDDVEYVRHGARAFLLRLVRPKGNGPFPVVVDIHGGAWTNSDRFSCAMRDEAMARAGIAAAALDFRQGSDGYPSSLIDINYAIRWLKVHAAELRLDPERIGLAGASSGAHLAMLCAMRPHDPRYGAHQLAGGPADLDARVTCVGMVAPVINPLSRYRRAVTLSNGANPPDWAVRIPALHDTYWKSEAAMAEGNPLLALERGETVEMPPAILIQGTPDVAHIYRDPDAPDGHAGENEQERFVDAYRRRGGKIDLVYVDSEENQSPQLYEPLTRFLAAQLGA